MLDKEKCNRNIKDFLDHAKRVLPAMKAMKKMLKEMRGTKKKNNDNVQYMYSIIKNYEDLNLRSYITGGVNSTSTINRS